MTTVTSQPSSDRSPAVVAALAAIAAACFLIVPRTSPLVVLALVAATALSATRLSPVPSTWRALPMPVIWLAVFGCWAAASTVWAADRGEAIGKSVILFLLTSLVWWVWASMSSARPEMVRHGCRWALAGFAIGLCYLTLEEIGGHSLKRLMFLLLPFTRLSDKHMVFDGDDVGVATYVSNRNMAAAMLALWPLLLIVWTLIDQRLRPAAMGVLVGLLAVSLSISEHETSIIALAASIPIFAVAWLWPRLALGLVAAGWLAATLLVVPLAGWGYHTAELHRASWLPNSARHRIVLWGYTAETYWSRPIAGIGASSTKRLDAQRGQSAPVVSGTKYQWRSGTHAHNAYLQTWYELGVVGALLLCAFGLALIRGLAQLPRQVLPFAAATLTAAIVMAATSWGMWQPWFMCAFAASAVLLEFAARLAEPEGAGSRGD
jgi:O-antigen ligase